MRRIVIISVAVTLLSAACGSEDGGSTGPTRTTPAETTPPTQPASPTTSSGMVTEALAAQLTAARLATAPYATDLDRAKADGYQIITQMIPDMGYHFLNPDVTGFDAEEPPILVYVKEGTNWQLVAVEWVFPEMPAEPPLDGALYGSFGAACHYADGTFVLADTEQSCATASPDSGSAFGFWHPPLVTMHVWLWYPNPDGLFAGTNQLVSPFNEA